MVAIDILAMLFLLDLVEVRVVVVVVKEGGELRFSFRAAGLLGAVTEEAVICLLREAESIGGGGGVGVIFTSAK